MNDTEGVMPFRKLYLGLALLCVPLLSAPLKTVIITGGHAFTKTDVFSLFSDTTRYQLTEAFDASGTDVFDDITGWNYDLVVFHNMVQGITETQKTHFLELLQAGTPVIFLHHVVAAYLAWQEFSKIIGVRYYLDGYQTVGDTTYPLPMFNVDIEYTVRVADSAHPVTQGLPATFTWTDEVYGNQVFEPDNQILLKTDHSFSDTALVWIRTYGNSRILTIQPGHGPGIFSDTNFQMLFSQGVDWVTTDQGTSVHEFPRSPGKYRAGTLRNFSEVEYYYDVSGSRRPTKPGHPLYFYRLLEADKPDP